uniref:Zinc finger and BTB domain containing 32 n=1 Tax=Seriola lalandi dorsalis TaxID=1841481 RepID=A0A3B4XLP7_SERLL
MIRINNTQYFHFLQQADALRRSGSLCDAIISVKSHTFRAHRLVLACASRRLAQQLAQGDIDCPARCTLEYFSPRTFQQVLDFTYMQALEVSVEDLNLLLRAAQLLEMESLEDQCRKQLDTLDSRASDEDKRGEMTDVKEEKERVKEMDQKKKESPVQEGKLQEASSTGEEASNSVVIENLSHPDSAKNHNSSSSRRKKPRLSPMSSKPYNRDSVIAGPATSNSNGVFVNTQAILPTAVFTPSPVSPHRVVCAGEACTGCQFCEGRDVVQHEPQSNRPDHRGDKPYQCQHCPKKFSLKHQLDTHHRVHTGEKPFECRLCGQRSRDYSAMIKHLRTHGGASPYQCTLCLEFCSSLVAMQRHIKSHTVQEFPPDWTTPHNPDTSIYTKFS